LRDHGRHHGGHQHAERRPVGRERGQPLTRVEAPQQRERGACDEDWQCQDVQAADVEHGQAVECMIALAHVVGVDRVPGVPKERRLREHGAFRTPRRPRGVDDQHSVGVAARNRRRGAVACERGKSVHRQIEAFGVRTEFIVRKQQLWRAVAQHVTVLGRGQAPVEWHEDGAEPREREQDDEDFGTVVGEEGDAVAARDAESRERARGRHDPSPQRGIGDVFALEADRALGGEMPGVALNDA
jgi:hypothetical protein